MKVIMPVIKDKESNHEVLGEFRDANQACIYDCDTNTVEWIPFKELIKNAGNLTLELKAKGIFTVISPYMSFLSLRLFNECQLTVLRAKGFDVETNIRLFIDKQLEPYSYIGRFGQSGCASSCTSCSSDCP